MADDTTQRAAFAFLREHLQTQDPFTLDEFRAATSWKKPGTLNTYLRKQYKGLIEPVSGTHYRVTDAFWKLITWRKFKGHVTQVRRVVTNYEPKRSKVLIYDFLHRDPGWQLFRDQGRLKEVFPGRFKKVKPAAVELHATLDLLEESLSKVTLTADTASERAALPKASSLGGCLLMADRGYFDRDYLLELTKAGASFVIRAQKGLNPKVLEAFDAQGRRIPKFVGKPLKTLRIAKRGAVNLRVRWKVQGQSLECRLIVTWNSSTKEFQYLNASYQRRASSNDARFTILQGSRASKAWYDRGCRVSKEIFPTRSGE